MTKFFLLESLQPGPISQNLPSTTSGEETSAEESLPEKRSPESVKGLLGDTASDDLLLESLQPGTIELPLPTTTSLDQTSAAEPSPQKPLPVDSTPEKSENDLPAETPPVNSMSASSSTVGTSLDEDPHANTKKPVVVDVPLEATEFTFTRRPPIDTNPSPSQCFALNPNAPEFTSQYPQMMISARQSSGICHLDYLHRDDGKVKAGALFMYLFLDTIDMNVPKLVKAYVW